MTVVEDVIVVELKAAVVDNVEDELGVEVEYCDVVEYDTIVKVLVAIEDVRVVKADVIGELVVAVKLAVDDGIVVEEVVVIEGGIVVTSGVIVSDKATVYLSTALCFGLFG